MSVLSSTNTFSFGKGGELAQFMQHRSRRFRKWLCKMHFSIEIGHHKQGDVDYGPFNNMYARYDDGSEMFGKTWSTVFDPDTLRSLRFLQTLHINIVFRQCRHNCDTCGQGGNAWQALESLNSVDDKKFEWYRRECVKFLTNPQALGKLRQVTVTAHSVGTHWLDPKVERLSRTRQLLRDKILGPHGRLGYSAFFQQKVEHASALAATRDELADELAKVNKLRKKLAKQEKKYTEQQSEFPKRLENFKYDYGTDDFADLHHKTAFWLEGGQDSDDSDAWADTATVL
ncbi:MAG: hypothetical protein MMC23_005153 [Stictis urceolatum]|nr:hypothetical protein [Stictis urceolata]